MKNCRQRVTGVTMRSTFRQQQGVALISPNRTGPPCSVGRPTAQAPGGWPGGGRSPTHPVAGQHGGRQRYRRRRQTTDASEQNNTGL